VEKIENKNYMPIKVANIISAFKEPNADPKLIAKQSGFRNHMEMAEYMKNKGYEWNIYKSNYIKSIGRKGESEIPDTLDEFTNIQEQNLQEDINKYIPFIQFLYEKRDEIYQLLYGIKEDGKIPRYALPGIARTKAIYMNDMVANLTAEFSKERNVTQREIVEAALIEFLQRYGYKAEVNAILKNN
jgi:hypothetical protein